MALHQVGRPEPGEAPEPNGADAGIEDVYSTRLSRRTLPKRRVPEREADPVAVLELIRSELAMDGNSSQNLATFCTTWAEPEVHALMDECLDKNMIDKDEYPQIGRAHV